MALLELISVHGVRRLDRKEVQSGQEKMLVFVLFLLSSRYILFRIAAEKIGS